MKMSMWKRVLSLVLAIVMVAPTVLNLIPEMGQEVEAVANWVDVGTLGADDALHRLNGIYEIYDPTSGLPVGINNTTSPGAGTLAMLTSTNQGGYQRWVIQYGGSNGTEHWYTIRNVNSGRLLAPNNNQFPKLTNTSVEAEPLSKWRILYDAASDTYSICAWQNFTDSDETDTTTPKYLSPVQNTGTGKDTILAQSGSYLRGMANPYGFKIKRIMVQQYGSAYDVPYGTYRIGANMDGEAGIDKYWQAETSSSAVLEPMDPTDPHANWIVTNGLLYSNDMENSKTDGSQTWIVDHTSGGYVTFYDALTGRYIGDRAVKAGANLWENRTTAFPGALADIVDRTDTAFDDSLRFFWIPIPGYTTSGTFSGGFLFCNVLTGRFLYINTDKTGIADTNTYAIMCNQSWGNEFLMESRTAADIAGEGKAQGFNGSTGVYLDSINQNDTIKLPIKIYDYVNDGMLFEYAQYVGNDADGNPQANETIAGKLYSLGNNRAYAFQAGSNGNTWVSNTAGYYAGKNEAGAWNTYKTFTLGKVWAQYTRDSDWLTQNGSPIGTVNGNSFNNTRNEYSWEAYGLAGFRGQTVDMDKDTASIYYMYGYLGNPPQGIGAGKTTYDGTGETTKTFTELLWQSDRMSTLSGTVQPRAAESATAYQYSLYGYMSGYATIGLVQAELNTITKSDGRVYRVPEYRDVVVEYLADLLVKTLSITQTNPNNSSEYAYNYVSGAIHERYYRADKDQQRDLAEWLRQRLGFYSTKKVGDYDTTYAKRDKLIGTWDECSPYIQTVCDAAYFMLNNLFVAGSYNEPQEMFDYLELNGVKVDDSNGNIVDAYVFDSGFTTGGTTASGSDTAVYYDTEEKTIRNTSVTGKASAFIDSSTPVCAHPFLPIWNNDFNMETQTGTQDGTKSPYLRDDGVTGGINDTATYANRNYNYVLASNGEFQYSYDDELFFNFEGDDDVYLFINGQLVLDIGGAHAITGFKINLNDYVTKARAAVASGNYTARDKALALEEGGIYSFDFYYMERHGWGSNMRIVTNIRVVEKGMLVDKDGAQFDVDLDTNDIVDPKAPVEYEFSLTNSGTEDLIWPTFVDSNIGVTISYNAGLTVTSATNGTTVMDKNGGTLDVTDLIVTYTNPKTGNSSTRTFKTNDDLIAYLTNELVIETQEKATPPFGCLTIGGIYYKLTDEQIKEGVFRNTVDVTAQIRNANTSTGPSNALIDNSTKQGLNTTITGSSVSGPVNGSITMTNGETTNRVYPYINYPNQVYINPEVGLYVFDTGNAVDQNGDALDVTDLVFTYTDPDGNVTVSTFTSNDELKDYLKTLVIEPGGTLTVDGVYFDPPVEEKTVTGVSSGIAVPELGLTITPENGLRINEGSNAVDANGDTLDVTDLTFIYTDPNGNTETKTFTGNDELKSYLENLDMTEGGSLTVEGIYSKPAVSQSVVINTIQRDDANSTVSNNVSTGDTLEDSADFTVFVPNEPKYYHWRDHEMVISLTVLTEDIMTLMKNTDNPLSTMFKPVVQSIDTVALADKDGKPITSTEVWVDSSYNVHTKYQTTGVKLIYLNIGYTYKSNSTTKTATATIPVQIFVVDTQSYVYVLDYGLRVELTYDELFNQDVLTVPDRDTKHEIYGVDNERNSPVYANNNVLNFTRFINTLTNEPAWGWGSSGDIDGSVYINDTSRGENTYLTYTPQNFMDGRDYVYVGIRVSEEKFDTTNDNFNVTDIRNEAEMFKTITFMPANVVYYEDNFAALNVNSTVMNRFKLENLADNTDSYIFPVFTDEDKGVTVSYQTGLTISATSSAVDKNGEALEVSDLIIRHKRADGTTEKKTFATNEELIAYLSALVIAPGESLNIAGIYYKMTKAESENGFDNEVTTQVSVKDPAQEGNVAVGEAVSGTVTTTTNAVFERNEEADQAQSSDQDVQYGYDDVYADSADVTMSGGTIATVVIGETREDGTVSSVGASFTFKGTGFEFISRGNALDSAIVEVAVTDESGNVKYYPVATKFDQQANGVGGTECVYQIPVFRLEDLPYGEYDVVISGIPSIKGLLKDENGKYVRDEDGRLVYEYATSYLYIDGIRIYNPLGTGSIDEYGDENGAQFDELRTLVFNDKAAVISLTTDEQTKEPVLSGTFGHHSFTENLYAGGDKTWFATNAGGLDQFIIAGPNNEVYVDGNSNVYAVVLYVKETNTGTEGLLNIGVHDIHDDDYYGFGSANSTSSISYWMESGKWISPIEVGSSGTEQYYAIDYRNCPTVELGGETYYSVVVQVWSGMVSFTNVKTVGLTFASLGSLAADVYYKYNENGVLCQGTLDANGEPVKDANGQEILTPVTHTFVDKETGNTENTENVILADLFSLRRALVTTATADGPEIELPELPEETAPEETTPEETTPEETTPEETTPEDTTPEDTTPEDTTPEDDQPGEEIPETGDLSWWEYLLDFFFEA